MNMKNKILNKVVKAFIIGTLLTISSIAVSKAVDAASWIGGMTSGIPTASSNKITGYFPQTISGGGIAFCNDQSSMVRWGNKDYKVYYPSTDNYGVTDAYNGVGDKNLISVLKGKASDKISDQNKTNLDKQWKTTDSEDTSADNLETKAREYPSSVSVTWMDNESSRYASQDQPLMMIAEDSSEEDGTEFDYDKLKRAIAGRDKSLQDKFSELRGEEKPQDLAEGYDSETTEYPNTNDAETTTWNGTTIAMGPQVAIIGNGDSSLYTRIGGNTIDTRTSNSYADIMNAYIYSGEYHKSRQDTIGFNLIDIQVANWLQNDDNHNFGGNLGLPHGYITDTDGNITSGPTLTQGSGTRGQDLYSEARDYYKFTNQLKADGGYKATVNIDQAQVFVSRDDSNRENDEYIIGPVSITYPYYNNISYMTDIILEASNRDGSSATLSYSGSDFEIIMQSQGDKKLTGGTIYPGENGISNENFYIVVNASKANYPEEFNIKAQFEYTDYCKSEYNTLYNDTNVWRYVGLTARGTIEYKVKFYWAESSTDTKEDPTQPYVVHICNICGAESENDLTCGHYNHRDVTKYRTKTVTKLENKDSTVTVKAIVMQAYVFMDTEDKYGLKTTDVTQEVITVPYPDNIIITPDEPEPEIKTYAHKATAIAENKIDLTIKLGGKVWVDGTAGKESKYDGQFINSTDTPMSGVKVVLHQRKPNGSESVKAETKTDTNGNYTFENLNALYTYYVEFVYNGQYYQPTIYKAEGTSWANSSKGVDIISERQSFNAKFAEIGSNPQNYKGGEVYTRAKLEEMGAIDKFGNPTGNNKYVNDCMMSSYTGYNQNGSFHREYYPVYNKFVISDSINGANRASIARDSNGQSISTYSMLYNGEYNNLHINQGYVLREEVDLAIKKDVYTATLEINGKTQTYNYDKRQLNEDGAWEISTRISDGYYNANYSRELYREDYEYNVDTYKTKGIDVSKDKELKVYVTYKFTIRNQSDVLAGRVTEIVDYYDQEYTFIPGRTYLGDKNGNKLGDITGSEHSIYGTATESKFAGYKNVYLTGMENVLLDPDMNKDLYVYVTFMVNKDNGNIILDEQLSDGTPIGVGKENIAEINGYKSYYGSRAHAPNENNPKTTTEYTGSKYDENGNLIKEGDVAGKTDKDSNPGNLNPNDVEKDGNVKYYKFEDDTDKAPNIRIILNRDNIRTIDGTVWEDERTITEANAQVGDGIRQENEIGVNGVRVQLVEILENGQEYIWKEVNSGDTIAQTLIIDNTDIATKPNGENVVHSYNIEKDGQYKFVSFAPGNYIVRFIYGDGTSTVLGTKSTDYYTGDTIDNPVTDLVNTLNGYNKTIQDQGYNSAIENIGLNEKSYNGQDYKSTTYQYNANNSTGVNNGTSAYEATESKTYSYNFAAADEQLYSDAKDIMSRRQVVNSYSTSDITNHKAEVLASFERIPTYNEMPYDAQQIADLLNEFIPNTYMIAETGTIDVNFEYNRTGSGTSSSGNSNIGTSNYDMSGYYNITNLDLGLEQRPKAQLKVSKQITNVKVKLANGSTLFDASSRATNVLWSDHIAHGLDTKNTYTTSNNYENSMMKTPVVRQNSKDKGLIQLTMDEELMHGATIQITYAITVANVGEVDYNENQFYYTGKVANTSTIVKTIPNVLIDYVGFQAESGNATRNNLQFIAEQNPDWSIISTDDLLIDGLLNINLTENANSYTTIVKTDSVSKALKPIIADEDKAKEIDNAFKNDPLNALNTVNSSESVVGVQLVLSQMITSDNKTDDMTYNNLVELVKTSNEAGRRMAYSVVGNQDPKLEPQEIDADNSQEVTILPPFGQNYIYYVLGGAIAIILIAGIVFTIRVVRKRR